MIAINCKEGNLSDIFNFNFIYTSCIFLFLSKYVGKNQIKSVKVALLVLTKNIECIFILFLWSI